jgi:hypothetical protein
MLTLATLGMFLYGAYSFGWALIDVVRGAQLELWAEAGVVMFGLLLALSAAFVRVRLPGGLAFAIGAMLGLQALAVHNAVHLAGGIGSQVARGVMAMTLVAMAASAKSG